MAAPASPSSPVRASVPPLTQPVPPQNHSIPSQNHSIPLQSQPFLNPTPLQTRPISTSQPFPPPLTPPPSLSSMATMFTSLSHTIAEKLTDKNFLLWKQQVEPVIIAHRLHPFLVHPQIPAKYASDEERLSGIVSEEFRSWEQKDAFLRSWLQSTLSAPILTKMIGCNHSYQLWEKIHNNNYTHVAAKAQQLRLELHNTSLGNKSVEEFLLRVKAISDSLSSVGDPISFKEQLAVILGGLPPEYASFVSMINITLRYQPHMTLDDIEALLLAQESQVEQTKKVIPDFSVNLTHTQPSNPTFPSSQESSQASNNSGFDNDDASSDHGGRGRGRGKGKIQCQVCFKPGHSAAVCYHRFNAQYVPKPPPQSSWEGQQNSWRPPQPPWQQPSSSPWQQPPSPWQQSSAYPPWQSAPVSQQWPNHPSSYPRPPSQWSPSQHIWPSNQWTSQSPPVGPHSGSSTMGPSQSQGSASQQQSQSNAAQAYLANMPSPPASSTWYPDSGASHHVTPNGGNIQQPEPFEGPDQIYVGNGQGLTVSQTGSTSFPSPFNSQFSLTLNNLLHVPKITKNLLSVSKFAHDKHVYFEFHSNSCYVKSQANNQILLQGKVGTDGLYAFPSMLSSSTVLNKSLYLPTVNTVSKCTSFMDWHNRLGHPSHDVLHSVLSSCNIPIHNKKTVSFCKACCMGKIHKLPSTSSNTVYSSPLELVFSDLWGPAPYTSQNGFKYYMSFVDAHTRFTWIYFLKVKSEAFTIFQQFKLMAELQFGDKLKSLQTDWGGEFRSFTIFLKNQGILHRLICPHTHHQNGVIERKHRHIVELGLTLLAHASIPLSYWDHSFQTSVYLINRLPSKSVHNSIPYTLLFNKTPDYSFLRTFGCSCFPNTRPYNKHKLDFRTQHCVFLGYSTSHKGYKCLTQEGKLLISKDVIFDETTFPYSSLFSTQSAPSPPSLNPVLSSIPVPQPSISLPNPPQITTNNVPLSSPSSDQFSIPGHSENNSSSNDFSSAVPIMSSPDPIPSSNPIMSSEIFSQNVDSGPVHNTHP